MQKGKKIAIIAVCAVLVLAIAGGVLLFATTPRHAVDFDNLTPQNIRNLHRQQTNSARQTQIPRRLGTLVGNVQSDTVIFNGTQASAMSEGETAFVHRQFLLTDRETHAQLHEIDLNIQREMMLHALTMLALVHNLQEVRFVVEFTESPEGNTVAQYLAQQSGNYIGRGGYAFRFCADIASRIIGRDIRTVADDLDSFTAFMHDIVAVDFDQLQHAQRPRIRPETR
ncbi:MAG: hypothetical protein FWE40_02845 [Oscillospiraceae bacterium]|nr:hypothetical protein [Oscillospiraceae bacterium]